MKVYTLILLLTFGSFTQNQGINVPNKTNALQTPDYAHWTVLLQKHVSDDGNVNYEGFKQDWSPLKRFIQTLSTQTPNEHWSKEQVLSYWINAYNALTIDLILRHYPVESIKDIRNPWKQALWTLGSKTYDLDTIEHEILRKMQEPRIHFAIVCASYSCPKLKNSAYTPDQLNDQLQQATVDFINDPKRNELSENSLEISKIFKWFRNDFEEEQNFIDFLNQFTEIEISKTAQIRYQTYNWELND
ncbi:DUF547 domain-containing protein [Gaetbulibacter sp. M240]|uniref:DUF547 domain-containing protein n=1 Tax=Gaetbulibacter sp. M240 TaxID=3126511 RepID=UPI00374E86D4